MRGTKKFSIKKLLFTFFALLTFCLCANAEENVITSVVLSQPADESGQYRLMVKSDKPVDYKAKTESDNSIYFDLKNSIVSENLNTIYDNVSDVDSVIVQQLQNSKVRIYVSGKNADNTKLVFKDSSKTTEAKAEKITINRPISDYRPTNNLNYDAKEEMDWEDNSFNPEHLANSFLTMIFGEKSDMSFIVCLILLVLCITASKKLFAKIKIDEEPLIGLSSQTIRQDLQVEKEQKEVDFIRPQTHLQRTQKPMPLNTFKESYARNAYQSAQKNPYVTSPAMKPVMKPATSVPYIKPRTNPAGEKYITRPETPASKAKIQTSAGRNVDSIKFLESVTKIYEQSGRGDLAQGLRVSINKTKTTV